MEDGVDKEIEQEAAWDELAKAIAANHRASRDATADWRDEAKRAYNYVACKQYTDQEIAEYDVMEKAPVTFNRSEVFVQTIKGLEALNRNEVTYSPRRPGPVNQAQADIWNQAAKYINDKCDAESAHADAFADLVVCGMGWTDTSLDFEDNPDGDLVIERVDPLSTFWSPKSSKRNVADSPWRGSVTETTVEEVRARWPDAELKDTGMEFALDADEAKPHNTDPTNYYRNGASNRTINDDETCWLVKYQYEKRQKYVVIASPMGQKEIPEETYASLLERMPDLASLPTARISRKTYRQAYCVGKTILEDNELDVGGFTLQCMTGKFDRNANTWYGIMRNLFDPQDWLNKLFSQIMFILSTNAKGGILAEYDAFANPQKAESEWARPDKITFVEPGALQNGKIQPKPMAEYPAGFDRLMQFSMSMFTDVTGQSLELMGLAERVQPGVLEAQRKQAGITILSWAFDALRSYRHAHGKIQAKFISNYLADGRLVKVVGKEGAQYVPLIKDQLAAEYDIIVDESPTSPNQKERVFQMLVQMLPTLQQMGIPIPTELLDYSPLPGSLVEIWKRQLTPNPQQQAKKAQEAKMAKQLAIATQTATIDKTQAEAHLKHAQAAKTEADQQLAVTDQIHKIQNDNTQNRIQAVKLIKESNSPTPRG